MVLFRRVKVALYRWRIARIDRRLDALQARRAQTEHADLRQLGLAFDALAIDRAVMARRLGRLADGPRARAGDPDGPVLDRLALEQAAAQRELEAGRARRAR